MGNLFGIRRRAPVVTNQDRAILQLKQQRDKIKIYQKRTEADLQRNKELARELLRKGFQDRALVILRRKKCLEEILNRTEKQQEVLEQLVNDIEYTQIEVSVVEGLKVGTEALKQLNNLMSIDDIQQIMDDNAEAAEKQREIDQIIQQSSIRFDEDELLEELESLKGKQEAESERPNQDDIEIRKPEAKEPEAEPESTSKLIDVDDTGEEAIMVKIDQLPSVPDSLPEQLREKEQDQEDKQEKKKERQPVLA